MVKKLTMILAGIFLSIGIATAQTQISGTVVDSGDGEPVIGATVMVVGANGLGAATDIDGNFSLSLPSGHNKLRITAVGYVAQEVTASNGMVVRMVSDSKVLDDVVVLGYGSGKKVFLELFVKVQKNWLMHLLLLHWMLCRDRWQVCQS